MKIPGLRDFLVRANELIGEEEDSKNQGISDMLLRIRYIYLPPYA